MEPEFESDTLKPNALAAFWKTVTRRVPLPEFIEKRARGTMKRENGVIRELIPMTWDEYNAQVEEERKAALDGMYDQMDQDLIKMLYGDKHGT
jgi:hypothetical protein